MNAPVDAALLGNLIQAADADGITKHVVGAVITNTEGKVLLLHRAAEDYLGGLWELPSGGVDEGESLTKALAREITEETGLTVTGIETYLGHFDYLSRSGKRPVSSTSLPRPPTRRTQSNSPNTMPTYGPTPRSRNASPAPYAPF